MELASCSFVAGNVLTVAHKLLILAEYFACIMTLQLGVRSDLPNQLDSYYE